ncbi:putative rIIA [Vibrio phage VPMCC14]|nr:putative rIIA [Vibrio phage VPMCC14]
MAVPVTPEYEVSVGKSKESQEFGFHFSAKLARTLAETLYDYKIEAVVREYSTNITDSHTDAGFPEKQGYVEVPTKMSPNIKFQDFGVGMSKDTIFKIYTVFGKSTKEHDNTTNGSLGYGSKAAFSISEQFTVTSVKNGVKTVVVCYKDRTGLPKADVKSEKPTDESNGTTVEIPVNLNKINEWQEACARVLGVFRVPHKVNTFGDYERVYEEIRTMCLNVREKGSLFIQNPNTHLYNHRSNTMILMGDVLYHLPDFDKLVGNTKIKSLVTNLVNSGVYVTNFNIGDLDHAPSREAISYDPQTFLKVRKRVNSDIKNEYRKFNKEMDLGGDVSFYKFYKQYRKSSVWEMIKDLELPFLDGNTLHKLDPEYKSSWSSVKVMFLLNNNKYGKIKGIVPSVSMTGNVFSQCVDSFYQDRLISINKPVVVYSKLDKGLYKVKDTLEVIHKEKDTHVLYAESEHKAHNIAKWFGTDDVICGDSYSPEKVSKSKGSVAKRGSYGIKTDHETVATYITVDGGDYITETGKVNLAEEGVYWVAKDEYITVKGVVPKIKTTFTTHSSTLAKMLNLVGGKKVVIKNLNNKGKIERANVPYLGQAVAKEVKSVKPELIKYLVHKTNRMNNFTNREKIIIDNKINLCKLKTKVENFYNPEEKVKLVAELSDFGLKETKLYDRHYNSKLKVYKDLKSKVNGIMESLPLADKFGDYYDSELEGFKYYLKLEKIIK